ncbi:NTP transferase domain-containing protein [bacterium]|nr:NTP transferase domain-containing protein [candidate division CSSED10-310 bacterium]
MSSCMESSRNNVYGVILAAGTGARIRPLSIDMPKPLLPVCNRPVIAHQIDMMKAIGIRKFRIVVGHLGRYIMEEFGNGRDLGVEIRYVIQEKPLGIAHAVYQLEDELDGPMMLFLGDIFFMSQNLDIMVRTLFDKQAAAVLAVKRESRKEMVRRNFSVTIGPDNRVLKVVEKPRYVQDNLKGCGIYLFDLPIFDAIRRTPRTAMRDEYEITTSIQILIDDGYPVYPEETVQWDMNVTVPEDLLYCNLAMLKIQAMDQMIHPTASLAPGSTVSASVIGADAVIEHPINISHSLILPGTRVTSRHAIDWQIITPDNAIQCPESDPFALGETE